MDPSAKAFIPRSSNRCTTTGANMSYFANFRNFAPDPTAGLQVEFARLAIEQGWGRKSNKRKEEWRRACEAEFETHIGAAFTGGRLLAWQNLCEELGVGSIPSSITQCKKALKKIHVNLVDLIDKRRREMTTGTRIQVTVFKSHKDLVLYTQQSGKIFPLVKAKKNELLKVFLREIRR